MKIEEKSFLYLAIIIPIAMIIIVWIGSQYYKKDLRSEYNFLYVLLKSSPDQYFCVDKIKSELFPSEVQKVKRSYTECVETPLYVYNSQTESSSPISLSDAQKLKIPKPLAATSPDGFNVQYYCQPEGIGWWFVNSNFNICLVKKDYQKKLSITSPNDKYFFFLGWIEK